MLEAGGALIHLRSSAACALSARPRTVDSSSTTVTQATRWCCPPAGAPAVNRYSPNLSKRTTHLVTPEVVGSVTQKLAAAAGAGPGQQQRFKALQVVSQGWVSASAGLRARADETQFAPLLPPPDASACSAEVSVSVCAGSRRLLRASLLNGLPLHTCWVDLHPVALCYNCYLCCPCCSVPAPTTAAELRQWQCCGISTARCSGRRTECRAPDSLGCALLSNARRQCLRRPAAAASQPLSRPPTCPAAAPAAVPDC